MTTIEQTRKELEDTRDKQIHTGKMFTIANLISERLEGFNLGVSLAQKEFLENLNFHGKMTSSHTLKGGVS